MIRRIISITFYGALAAAQLAGMWWLIPIAAVR